MYNTFLDLSRTTDDDNEVVGYNCEPVSSKKILPDLKNGNDAESEEEDYFRPKDLNDRSQDDDEVSMDCRVGGSLVCYGTNGLVLSEFLFDVLHLKY